MRHVIAAGCAALVLATLAGCSGSHRDAACSALATDWGGYSASRADETTEHAMVLGAYPGTGLEHDADQWTATDPEREFDTAVDQLADDLGTPDSATVAADEHTVDTAWHNMGCKG